LSRPNQVKPDIHIILGTLFGIGFFPVMPGTIGTLAAACVYLLMPKQWFYDSNLVALTVAAIIVAFLSGVYITRQAEKKLGHDAGPIIWDEFVGYFVAVLLLPKSLLMAIYCFAIFRVFDIAKPWIITKSQSLKHGWGIMTDDLLAGLATNVFMQILVLLYRNFFVY